MALVLRHSNENRSNIVICCLQQLQELFRPVKDVKAIGRGGSVEADTGNCSNLTMVLIRIDFDKHFNKKINDTKTT